MGERCILGIDIGTTSVKTILISSEGYIADETTQNHDLLSLYPGWAEEDASVWWQDTVDTVQILMERNPDKRESIAGIGVSGMVPAIVMLDEADQPVRNTIQQNDARAIIWHIHHTSKDFTVYHHIHSHQITAVKFTLCGLGEFFAISKQLHSFKAFSSCAVSNSFCGHQPKSALFPNQSHFKMFHF